MNTVPLVRLEEVLQDIQEKAKGLKEDERGGFRIFLGDGMLMATSRIYSLIYELMDEEEEE